jgi:chromosome segregation ATPase
MPSCAKIADVKKQLAQQQEESSHLSVKLTNVQSLLEIATDKTQSLQTQLKAAVAELQTVKADKASETHLLDELWQVFKAYRSGVGYSSYSIASYARGVTISAELKKRVPGLS